ncbi:P-loop containing nucleoside triphosphate hydrolase protein [Cyathus striatus]|nr:P-loop containing nucleoside triphosphate hydrolase protein [Cyathus striatus]
MLPLAATVLLGSSQVAGFILPATFVAITFLYDIGSSIFSSVMPLKNTVKAVRSPFTNFVTFKDLPGPIDASPRAETAFKVRSLITIGGITCIAWTGYLAFSLYISDNLTAIVRALSLSLSWAYVTFRTISSPPSTPPYMSLLFCMTAFLGSLGSSVYGVVQNDIQSSDILLEILISVPSILFSVVAGSLPMYAVRPSMNVAQPGEVPSVHSTCPEDDITLWSWSSFKFVEPILFLATKRTLNEEDVWSLSPFFSHSTIFGKHLEYRRLYPKHTLLRFLLVSNSLDLILDVVLEMWSAVVGFVPPYALKKILAALTSGSGDLKSAYFWSLVTFLVHLSFAQVDLFQSWHTRRCYERSRGQLFCIIHYKSLKRRDINAKVSTGNDEDPADLGKIVNLMQGDAYAVAQRFWEFSGIFTSPVRLTIALTFLYQILGWSAFAGVVVIILAYALNYPLAKYNISITRSSWKAKDKRMNVVNELLQNIRFLKFYGWEYTWSREAEKKRETELDWRVKQNIVETFISFIWIWIPSATALATFLCYTLIAGEQLTVSKAFTSIALFSQLQEPMTALPGQFFAMLHAHVSMQRIESFLREDEVADRATTLSMSVQDVVNDTVGFADASFSWDVPSHANLEPARFQLGPLDIIFPPGKLSLITGPTGSGKTALLSALLGEMTCISGRVRLNKSDHRVAYCGQAPWLEHATIRDNIIFGSSRGFNEVRYNEVLDACGLLPDLSIFAARDMTEIGEKGITLSGGQRARIALARAMYSDAKVLLLDDPLAAVDMHTAQHLVTRCLSGSLACDRTIILVTHHVTLCLSAAAYMVALHKGNIIQQGTLTELAKTGALQSYDDGDKEPEDPRPSFTQISIDVPDHSISDNLKLHSEQQSGNGKLVEIEHRAEGRVSFKTYKMYIHAAGAICWVLTLLLMFLIRLINITNQVFLASWGEAYEETFPAVSDAPPYHVFSKYPWDSLPSPNADVKPWLMIYLYISMAGAFSVLFYIAIGYYASLKASRSLFTSLLRRITRAPARFFDTTPIGRILNRFTTDINTVDGALQNSARSCLSGILNFLASFTVILVVVPTFAPFALVIAWLYIRLAGPYIQASRDLRRLESVSLSPAFAGFDELLRGITHIRAFGMETRYQDRFYERVDKFQSFDHVYWLVNGWLRWRYDCLGSVVVFTATTFALWKGVTDGSAAIVIVQAGIFAEASRQLVRVAAQLELDFNSVERIVEYLDVPQESPAVIDNFRPPAYWPSSSGEITIENLYVRYAPHLQPVLRNLSLNILPGEKIGIVGRTGSGKSTLALSLLRMVEPMSGRIIVDGIDISTIGLEDLRQKITIISQDVSLFSGTIRSNLDPLEDSTSAECLEVIRRCHLTSILNHLSTEEEPTPLDMKISQGSLSAGEKQLVALARAILRRTTIIIMDEATSQIDEKLDEQIQQTIREELSTAIVITIAHRLKTVMECDRIIVLNDGEIVEIGGPNDLLKKAGGAFRELCRKSADWTQLVQMHTE